MRTIWTPQRQCASSWPKCYDFPGCGTRALVMRAWYIHSTRYLLWTTPYRCGYRGGGPCARFGRLNGSVRPRGRNVMTFRGAGRALVMRAWCIHSTRYLLWTTPYRCGYRGGGPYARFGRLNGSDVRPRGRNVMTFRGAGRGKSSDQTDVYGPSTTLPE
jgi:hypothetical protein